MANPRGYAGLIGLLIVAAIVSILVWRPDILSPSSPTSPSATTTPVQRSQIEQGMNAVDAAKDAKARIEGNYAKQQQEVGN